MVKKNKSFKKKVPISKCTVVGNNWGLICNSIHLWTFFVVVSGEKLINCNSKDLVKIGLYLEGKFIGNIKLTLIFKRILIDKILYNE